MQDAFVLLMTGAVACLVFYPRVAQARSWRATPPLLASIIGTAFWCWGRSSTIPMG